MPDDLPKLPRQRKQKNKPKDTPWRQQRLAAKRPVLNIQFVFPWIIILGVIILGLGLGLYFSVNKSLEQKIEYTDCRTINDQPASDVVQSDWRSKPQCILHFSLDEDYKTEVKFYYQLNGFYQNFRTYLSSRNDKQLIGDLDETDGCKPLECVFADGYNKSNADCDKDDYKAGKAFPIAPCGVIANSMFNDSYVLYYNPPADGNNTSEDPIRVPFSIDKILSKAEKEKKFKNPSPTKDPVELCKAFEGTVKPPSWQIPICELGAPNNETDDPDHDDFPGLGFENIDFMVWMKAAALPNFRKPYRFLNKEHDPFTEGLKAGNYTLVINYNYPVKQFKIKKYFVIAHENWIGPRNFFLPIIYMVTGVFIILASIALRIFAWIKNRCAPAELPS